MENNTNEQMPQNGTGRGRSPQRFGFIWPLATVLSLAAVCVLAVIAHNSSTRIADLESQTQAQLAKFNDQMAQSADENKRNLETVAQTAEQAAHDNAAAAQAQATSALRKTNAALSAKLEEDRAAQQQTAQQVAGELDQLKEASTTATSKLSEIDTNVSGVKDDVASTRTELQQTGSDLKRVTGDMGVMSDRVATNAKELGELRALGERDYMEFDLKRGAKAQKVGVLQLALAKADPKRHRFTLDVLADDKLTEKRDRTINEPVQFYVSGGHQPYEIVVNEVKKDEVVGYLAVPKVTVASR
jgi:septal ring factor EnvC (AmiA/AmiB activator)